MKAKIRDLLQDIVAVAAIVALLTCLAMGQIALAVLIMLALTFFFFAGGRHRK